MHNTRCLGAINVSRKQEFSRLELEVELVFRLFLDAWGRSMCSGGRDLRMLKIKWSLIVIFFKLSARVVDFCIAESLKVGLHVLLQS